MNRSHVRGEEEPFAEVKVDPLCDDVIKCSIAKELKEIIWINIKYYGSVFNTNRTQRKST